MATWLGYRWLSERYGVAPVQPFRVDSQLAKSRTTERSNGFTHEFYTPQFKPKDTFAGHVTFALKREGVHLEFLARLFQVLPPADLDAWLADEPTGQYSRRTGFLYEWLTENRLEFGGVGVGNYIDAWTAICTSPLPIPKISLAGASETTCLAHVTTARWCTARTVCEQRKPMIATSVCTIWKWNMAKI